LSIGRLRIEVLVERQSALDVHKAQVTACVRVPDGDGGRLELIEQFQTTVDGSERTHG